MSQSHTEGAFDKRRKPCFFGLEGKQASRQASPSVVFRAAASIPEDGSKTIYVETVGFCYIITLDFVSLQKNIFSHGMSH